MSGLLSPEYLAAERDRSNPGDWIELLLDHIDAMAAGEAKLRALHHEDEHGYCPADGDDWPCDTIRILDGET